MNKEDFINKIANMDIDELQKFIKSKGKPPKKIQLFHIVDKEKYPTFESLNITDIHV